MDKIYYDLIREGLKGINEVPQKWKAKVQALLDLNDTLQDNITSERGLVN